MDFQLQRVPMARIEGSRRQFHRPGDRQRQVTLTDAAPSMPGVGGASSRPMRKAASASPTSPPGSYRLIVRAQGPSPIWRDPGRERQGRCPAPVGRARAAAAVRSPPDPSLGQRRRAGGRPQPDQRGGHAAAGTHRLGPHRVRRDDAQPPADSRGSASIWLPPIRRAPAWCSRPRGAVDATGKFTIPSVVPGLYRLTASGAGNGWSIESSIIDGQDTLDFPFEVKPGSAPGAP